MQKARLHGRDLLIVRGQKLELDDEAGLAVQARFGGTTGAGRLAVESDFPPEEGWILDGPSPWDKDHLPSRLMVNASGRALWVNCLAPVVDEYEIPFLRLPSKEEKSAALAKLAQESARGRAASEEAERGRQYARMQRDMMLGRAPVPVQEAKR